jgi:PmbA protein
MEKEFYTIHEKQTSITVTNSAIEAIRNKDITKTGCRVYENGLIGISGIVGEADQDTLLEQAKQNLSLKIPYTADLSSNQQITLNQIEDETSSQQVLADLEEILSIAREKYSDFILSNKVNIEETTTTLTNTKGTHLSHTTKFFLVQLLAREEKSSSIFDTFVFGIWKTWDKFAVLKSIEDALIGYRTEFSLPATKKLPVVFMMSSGTQLLDKFSSDLNGNKIGKDVSTFSPYMGQLKFNENFTLFQDHTGAMFNPFFDAEGVICENYKYPFIEKGVLKAGYTDKQTAAKLNLPMTGSSGSSYDGVPTLAPPTLNIESSGKTLKELLQGEVGLYVIMASGGDFTPDGHYASPVQLAMLTDGEKFLGRVPEFEISSHVFDLFGKDFVGVSQDHPFNGLPALVVNMEITSK